MLMASTQVRFYNCVDTTIFFLGFSMCLQLVLRDVGLSCCAYYSA